MFVKEFRGFIINFLFSPISAFGTFPGLISSPFALDSPEGRGNLLHRTGLERYLFITPWVAVTSGQGGARLYASMASRVRRLAAKLSC